MGHTQQGVERRRVVPSLPPLRELVLTLVAMRRGPLLIVLFFFTVLARPEIVKIEVDGAIEPIRAQFIRESIEEAANSGAEFLLMRLATPGGLGVSTQEIIQDVLNSPVPVVCYVSPNGSHAASAGFFILLSADVAAMAPGTNTGAAHPVFPFGAENKTMEEKVVNDLLANLRSIVARRERNYELAEQGVVESKSYTSQEALDGGLIDLIAENEQDLLERLDGFEVRRLGGEVQTLQTRGQSVRLRPMSLRQRILSAIADPNLAAILGMIGLLGLYLEFSSPGLIFPGVVGGICLVLSFLGFSFLPVNYIGVLLVLLAAGLLIAEGLVQGFGILGFGGAISLVLGLLLLVDSPYPELRIGLGVALLVAIPFAFFSVLLIWVLARNWTSRVQTGNEGLEGLLGTARSRVDENGGKVFVNSEWWNAVSREPIETGSRVRVIRADNLQLEVEPLE